MLHPNRNLLLSALLLLGVSASPVVSADEEAPAPARAFTQAQALQDLTAIIECRAPASVPKQLSPNLWAVALGNEVARPFDTWAVVEQPNASLHEVALPEPITVFGHSTTRIAVLSEAVM
ncbi:hypothetical protein ACFWGO_32570, partial [Streptomyces griseoaurantiacus]